MLQKQYNFLPRFSQLAIASVVSNIMVPLEGLVDLAFLGHLPDISYLAGVILATILFDYLYRAIPLRTSTNALTAQAVGLNDPKGILLAGLRSGLIALGLSVIILVWQYPIEKLGFSLLNGSPEIEAAGVGYFYGRIWGTPAVFLNFGLCGWFLGQEMNQIVLWTSVISNVSNLVLDYITIMQWGWGSMGAGLATALSQYIALITGLVWVGSKIDRQYLSAAFKEVFQWQSLQAILFFNTNILIRFLCLFSVYGIITNISATMGTTLLAQNGLLLQIVILNQFIMQGISMTTQTLTGNFYGKGEKELLNPLLQVSLAITISISLTCALVTALFPAQVFGILTNHTEVSADINRYIFWLLPLLTLTGVAFTMEGYFIGLKEVVIIRNAALMAFFIGFLPFVTLAFYWHNNHILWWSLVSYLSTVIIVLVVEFVKRLGLASTKPQLLS